MATHIVLLPLNTHRSFPLQHRNLSSLKITTTIRRRPTSTLLSPSITLPPPYRALDNDSNSQTPQDDGEVNNPGVTAALTLLRFYKREISPILPKSCRYVPTCSEYSMEAYKRYGFVKGTVLTAWRICRCNPLGGRGYDPPRWFGEISPSEEVDD